ncbi:DUF533 domain-containing protein [Vibrio sp. 10N.222.52.C3]|uniref:DUF533 domain-containing protein n=1 Tax=unclassified Vibrio TaxID=2614977 RepID=UPI00355208CB
MPLPFIAAAAAGALTYKYFSGNDKKKTSSARDVTEKSLTKEQERELCFLVQLATSAAYADGDMCEKEKSIIQNYIDNEKMEYPSSKSLQELKIKEPLSIAELHRYWGAIKKKEGSWEAFIEEVISANDQHTHCEKAFLFRMKLMFEGLPDQQLFMLTDEEPRSTLSLDYINVDSLPENYVINSSVVGEFLIEHPAQARCEQRELISVSNFFDDSFLTSQDTELVNAARLAGAKKVTIYSGSKRSESISTDKELRGKASIGPQSGHLVSDVGASNAYSSADKKVVVYEFEGNTTSAMTRLKSMFTSPEKELLRRSTWLQNDEELTEFVKGCFSDNKLTYFKREFSTERQKNIINSAMMAADCDLVKVSAEAKSSLQEKGKFYEESVKKYEVAFV